ncbi:MAG: hypothetical protein M1368_06975 [Thaumarchaeota archaeon]|nr:hypothetical protein [Nitrososphaerota archaeon]
MIFLGSNSFLRLQLRRRSAAALRQKMEKYDVLVVITVIAAAMAILFEIAK